jgi:hypothetical protein
MTSVEHYCEFCGKLIGNDYMVIEGTIEDARELLYFCSVECVERYLSMKWLT